MVRDDLMATIRGFGLGARLHILSTSTSAADDGECSCTLAHGERVIHISEAGEVRGLDFQSISGIERGEGGQWVFPDFASALDSVCTEIAEMGRGSGLMSRNTEGRAVVSLSIHGDFGVNERQEITVRSPQSGLFVGFKATPDGQGLEITANRSGRVHLDRASIQNFIDSLRSLLENDVGMAFATGHAVESYHDYNDDDDDWI